MGNLDFVDPNTEPVSFEPLPIGKYEFTIIAADVAPNKAGTGMNLVLEFERDNRKLKEWLGVQNPSEEGQKIAQGKLSRMCRCIGMSIPNDSSKLLGKKVTLLLGIEDYLKDGETRRKNTIKDYVERVTQAAVVTAAQAKVEVPFQDDDIPF